MILYLSNIILIFRKISPANSRVAEKSLSKDANRINARRILINAQVTAVTCFLEISSNLLYQIIVKLAVKTSFATLLQFLIIYFIILPYAFLMNTSHNKNRVIEHGWKNVFKNIIGYKDTKISPGNYHSNEISAPSQCHSTDNSKRKRCIKVAL